MYLDFNIYIIYYRCLKSIWCWFE